MSEDTANTSGQPSPAKKGEAQETVHFTSPYFTVVGDPKNAQYIRADDKAMSVPLTDTGMVIFIVEPSPAFRENILYLPSGRVQPGETMEGAANREMQEEIGYRAERQDYLGELRPWVKYLQTRTFLFLARDLVPSKLHGDEIYTITTELVPLNAFERVIDTGRLFDATVIAALYRARHFVSTQG